MVDYERVEHQRAAFKGKRVKDPITGTVKKQSTRSSFTHNLVMAISGVTTLFCVGLVIALVVGLFFYRAMVAYTSWGPKLIAFLCALQIKLMNWLYEKVADRLTNWENHETWTSW